MKSDQIKKNNIDLVNLIKNKGVFVIAEIGKNFIQTKDSKSIDEYIINAKKLIDAAVDSGVDAVKFQTHELEDEQANIPITAPHFQGSERYEWVKRNSEELNIDFFRILKNYAENKGIFFFSTPMSRMAAEKLESIGVPFWKIGSGDVQDYLLLNYVCKTGKTVIISTGMVSHEELDVVVKYILGKGNQLIILYCVSKYPCPAKDFNLATIELFKKKYPSVIVGFSDHSVGNNSVPLSAINLGAMVIEKHFSFSRDLWGSDHKVSITPEEMKNLVYSIRNKDLKKIETQLYYGVESKELEGANSSFRAYFNKTLVAGKDMCAGSIITEADMYAMRPRVYLNGMRSDQVNEVIGRKLLVNIKKFEPIKEDYLL